MSGRPVRMAADHALSAYAASHTTASSGTLQAVASSTRAWSDQAELMIDETEAKTIARNELLSKYGDDWPVSCCG